MTPVIRLAARPDLPILLEIERQSFSHEHWTAESFLAYDCIVAEVENTVAGFLVSRQTFASGQGVPAEREILNLAVAPAYRRMGIATVLLNHELARGGLYFLEVRESNRAALALYGKIGFVPAGRRPEYYRAPREAAIVMKMKWC
ncbi:MAG: GNAT family N-acetyltransferase [Bryobacteraceae bacterium]